ncbi:hypothetical protein FFLO_02620 [Filobasidium floriforme]|uniref:diacylglycerol cholinephosphotransferase n=1 Tax=Filobasidium floriforme TaxID=5210 RepID=A0A8K0NRP0_9TREE|nr:uncharacterized protein HD553DRAFT_308286 [Filobasidium floriforme]KAG7561980.1 hypothetical protein FFLO_02620 [Filobasidium floriforme]KAH8087480.1 hypothetical protein HD553DRAFT_308286 [Filobasidium floriforme]
MGKLTRQQLEGLNLYKYSGVDKSLLSKTILTPYWNHLVTYFPKTIAPNTITSIGLGFVAVNIATLLFFDPKYEGKELPSWVYLSWGIGLFLYQSMDAIDGKQARRTGMAGPLGEMFDHGIDAINTSLEVILCMAAFGQTRTWWTVVCQASSLATFYLSTWEEYHTGTLYLSAFSGPVEGILLICGMYFITAAKTPAFWQTPVIDFLPILAHKFQSLVGMGIGHGVEDVVEKLHGGLSQLKWLKGVSVVESFLYFGALGLAGNIANAYYNVIQARRKANKPVLEPLLGLLPYFFHTVLLVAWLAGPKVDIVPTEKILWFTVYWAATFSYQVSHLILAHVTKSAFPYWNGMMIWTFLGAVDANLPRFGVESFIQTTDARTWYFVAGSALFAIANYVRFAKSTIWQITEYLGIACFTVRHKDQTGHWVENEQALEERRKRQ